MESVICDTNIWYNLASKRMHIHNYSNVQLIATSVNLIEISSTPNLLNNLSLVASTAKAIHDYASMIIQPNPIEYMIGLFHPDYLPDTTTEARLLGKFNILMSINETEIPKQNIIDTEQQIKELEKSQNDLAAKINNKLLDFRKEIKTKIGKEKYRKRDFIEQWKMFFSTLVKHYSAEYCGKEYELKSDSEAWEQLEFFLYSWDYFFKNNLELGNWKFHRNDWGDLFNLVYVNQNCKYWTIEKKWNRIFDNCECLSKKKFNTIKV